MIELTIDNDRYEHYIKQKSYHERFKSESIFWDELVDQASWYSLAGIKRHSDISFWDLENYGWNSECDEWTIYTVNELIENVQLFESKYNVTELGLETHGTFNINKVKFYNVVNRHFAGNQKWNPVWLNTNLFKITIYFLNPMRLVKFINNKYKPRVIGKIRKVLKI